MPSFSQALRSSSLSRFSRIKERQARRTGRPQTLTEAAAPYEALAETAGGRLAAGKSLELQERGQDIQTSQFGETLGQRKTEAASLEASRIEQQKIERERLAEIKRAEQVRVSQRKSEQQELMRRADEAGEVHTTDRVTGGLVGGAGGAFAGAKIGAMIGSGFPGIGTAIGAGVGFLAGLFGGKLCVIISACTGAFSYEVRITREYRDKYMGPVTHSGYHIIANMIVPYIKKYPWFKRFIKRYLVDRIVDYCEWVLGYKPKMKFKSSRPITRGFLGLCKIAGLLTVKELSYA